MVTQQIHCLHLRVSCGQVQGSMVANAKATFVATSEEKRGKWGEIGEERGKTWGKWGQTRRKRGM